MFKYLMYKFGEFCVNRMPLPLAYRIAMFVSDLHYYLSFRDRKAVHNNLKNIVEDESQVPYLVREVFRNFGKYLVEFFRMKSMVDRQFIKDNIEIKNIEKIQEVLDDKKGGLILTAHLGNWEMGAVIFSTLGYPLLAVAMPHKERPVNDLFNDQREAKGITVVPMNLAVRRCLEALKENKLVALVADRDFSQNGEVLPFLDRQALIPKGVAAFSLKTGAPIIPTFLIRKDDDTFTLTVCDPIYPPQGSLEKDEKQKIVGIIQQYLSFIEAKIRQHPTQWLMFREYWVK